MPECIIMLSLIPWCTLYVFIVQMFMHRTIDLQERTLWEKVYFLSLPKVQILVHEFQWLVLMFYDFEWQMCMLIRIWGTLSRLECQNGMDIGCKCMYYNQLYHQFPPYEFLGLFTYINIPVVVFKLFLQVCFPQYTTVCLCVIFWDPYTPPPPLPSSTVSAFSDRFKMLTK